MRGYGLLLLLVHFLLTEKVKSNFAAITVLPLPEFCCLVHGMVLVIFELHSKVWFKRNVDNGLLAVLT